MTCCLGLHSALGYPRPSTYGGSSAMITASELKRFEGSARSMPVTETKRAREVTTVATPSR